MTRPFRRSRSQLAVAAALLAALAVGQGATAATKTTKKTTKTTKKAATTKPAAKTVPGAPVTNAPQVTSAPAVNAKAKDLRVIVESGNDPVNWDAASTAAGVTGTRYYPVYGVLFYLDPNSSQPACLMCESISSADGLKWTIKLRKDIKFHDGSPFQADAIKTYWDRLKDAATASPGRGTALQVDTTTVVDPLTFEFTLTARNMAFVAAAQRSAMIYIPNPKLTSTRLDDVKAGKVDAGAGPFKLVNYKRDELITYEADPNWPFWPGGKPTIDQLTIRPVADEAQRYNALVTGAADLVTLNSPALLDKAKKDDRSVLVRMFQGGNNIELNQRTAPFNDARLRRALQLSIDVDAYEKAIRSGVVEPIRNLFLPDSPYYDKSQDFPSYDLPAAQKLIDDWAKDNGGRTLEFTLTAAPGSGTVDAQFLQAQWGQLKGVKVNIEQTPDVVARAIAKTYTVMLFADRFIDPDELYRSYVSDQTVSNVSGWNNAAVDKVMNLGRNGATIAERKAAYRDLTRALNFEMPVIFYSRNIQGWIGPKGLGGYKPFDTGGMMFDQIRF